MPKNNHIICNNNYQDQLLMRIIDHIAKTIIIILIITIFKVVIHMAIEIKIQFLLSINKIITNGGLLVLNIDIFKIINKLLLDYKN